MENNLSISIVVYKCYDDTLKLLESINYWTSKTVNKTIYLIDNSCYSSDEKKAFIYKLDSFKYVKYIDTNENLGFGKGHNYVIDELNSKYHAIVNPDILLQEDTFKILIDFMNGNPSIGMCIPRIIDENGQLLNAYRRELTLFDMFNRMFLRRFFKKREAYHSMLSEDFTKPFNIPFGQGSFLLVNTELYKKIGGFDERFFMYLEDADLCKRINEISELKYCPYTTVIHKWEKGSHKNFKLFKIHIISTFLYFKKWGWKLI